MSWSLRVELSWTFPNVGLIRCAETAGTDYPVTRDHDSGKQEPVPYRGEHLKTPTSSASYNALNVAVGLTFKNNSADCMSVVDSVWFVIQCRGS